MNPSVETSTLAKPGFVLFVPFAWSEHPADAGPAGGASYEFRNQSLPEHLLVTVLPAARPLGLDDRRRVVLALLQQRLAALQQLSNGQATCTNPDERTTEGSFELRLTGEDVPHTVRFAIVLRATATRVVSLCLYRYALQEIGTPFPAYAHTIFDYMQVE